MNVRLASRLVTQISLSGEEGVEGDNVVKQMLQTSLETNLLLEQKEILQQGLYRRQDTIVSYIRYNF